AAYFLRDAGKRGVPGPGKEDAGPKTVYQCPMHPTVIHEGPGVCPICGMDLVPMKQDSHGTAAASGPGNGSAAEAGMKGIRIDPTVVQNMGVRVDTVRRRELSREVRTTGKIGVDETRRFSVNAKIGGWVER